MALAISLGCCSAAAETVSHRTSMARFSPVPALIPILHLCPEGGAAVCLGSLENMGLESLGCSQEGHRSRDAGVGGDGCGGGGEGGMLTHLGGVLGCRRGCGL